MDRLRPQSQDWSAMLHGHTSGTVVKDPTSQVPKQIHLFPPRCNSSTAESYWQVTPQKKTKKLSSSGILPTLFIHAEFQQETSYNVLLANGKHFTVDLDYVRRAGRGVTKQVVTGFWSFQFLGGMQPQRSFDAGSLTSWGLKAHRSQETLAKQIICWSSCIIQFKLSHARLKYLTTFRHN